MDGYGHGAGEERGWKIDHFLCTSLMDDPIKYFIKNIFLKIILTTLNKFLKKLQKVTLAKSLKIPVKELNFSKVGGLKQKQNTSIVFFKDFAHLGMLSVNFHV